MLDVARSQSLAHRAELLSQDMMKHTMSWGANGNITAWSLRLVAFDVVGPCE